MVWDNYYFLWKYYEPDQVFEPGLYLLQIQYPDCEPEIELAFQVEIDGKYYWKLNKYNELLAESAAILKWFKVPPIY